MILIKKISIFCVFAFIFCLRPALVESADIDEINIMLRNEKDKLSKLKKEIENCKKREFGPNPILQPEYGLIAEKAKSDQKK